MDTPNLGGWSDLPPDLLRTIFQRLSFLDFRRAKLVCSNWNSSSRNVARQSTTTTTPWLMLFPHGNECCVLYNPEEDMVYTTTNRDFSGIRFLSSSGNWFLVLDSQFDLYIIDLFSENWIDLPPLESGKYTPKHVGDVLKGLLWVDEKTEDYIVVWYIDEPCPSFCCFRKGDCGYTEIWPGHTIDVALRDYRLYILSIGPCVRCIDFEGANWTNVFETDYVYDCRTNCGKIAVTTSGEVMLVESIYFGYQRSLYVYLKDYCLGLMSRKFRGVEVDSLDDEALLLDLGITVRGIEPNSIYFTRLDFESKDCERNLDIGVFNLETKTFERFPSLSEMHLKDARWFLPST